MREKKRDKVITVLITCYVIISMYEYACMNSFVFMLQFKFNNKKKEEIEKSE